MDPTEIYKQRLALLQGQPPPMQAGTGGGTAMDVIQPGGMLDQLLGVPAPQLDTTQDPNYESTFAHPTLNRIVEAFSGYGDQPTGPSRTFGEGLVQGFGRGLGGAGTRALQRRQQFETSTRERMKARDERNAEATKFYQEARYKAAATRMKGPDLPAGVDANLWFQNLPPDRQQAFLDTQSRMRPPGTEGTETLVTAEDAKTAPWMQRFVGQKVPASFFKPTAGTDATSVQDDEAIAGEIMAGRQDPNLVGMGRSGQSVRHIRAIFAKNKFNERDAKLSYYASQRFLSSLNGRQQVQIRQSANTVTPALDEIDRLSDRLAQLSPTAAAQPIQKVLKSAARDWGANGAEAQAVAQQLMTYIVDTAPELANIYQAGGVPSDKAMALAEKALNGDFPPNRLKASTAVTRKTLGYRLNSIANTEPVTAIPGDSEVTTLASDLMRKKVVPPGPTVTWKRGPNGKPVPVGGR